MNEQPKPNPDLKSLDRLIGTWKQSGEVEGKITYEWTEGGFFLIQYVDLLTVHIPEAACIKVFGFFVSERDG